MNVDDDVFGFETSKNYEREPTSNKRTNNKTKQFQKQQIKLKPASVSICFKKHKTIQTVGSHIKEPLSRSISSAYEIEQ